MIYRCQVEFQHKSGLPQDRFVNTFHFRERVDGNADAAAGMIETLLLEFYKTVPAGLSTSVMDWLSHSVFKSAVGKVYRLSDPTPRVPIEFPIALPTTQSGIGYPEEVAAVASLRTSLRAPRGRGRIYLGPLVAAAGEFDSVAQRVRPKPDLINTFVGATRRLAERTDTNMQWGVWSPSDQLIRDVTGGFVDNAFDTQRRRGTEATARTEWERTVTTP